MWQFLRFWVAKWTLILGTRLTDGVRCLEKTYTQQ